MGLWLTKKLRCQTNFFDFVCGKHGNHGAMTSQYGVVNYLRKEDSDPLCHGTYPDPSLKAPSLATKAAGNLKPLKTTMISESLRSGSCPLDIATQHPGFFLLHKKKVEDMFSFWQATNLNQSLATLPPNPEYRGKMN